MRTSHLVSSVFTSLVLLLLAAESRASESEMAQASDDASIGTTPARAPAHTSPPPPSQHVESVSSDSEDPDSEVTIERDMRRSSTAPIATDPPGNWAVLHAGLRPHLGTFGGIATLALAHARTERFYGGFSLSTVRNDAGTHIGIAQLALGRNLANDFGGGVQLSVSENRASSFIGLAQTSLGYNRALSMIALAQVATYNRAKSFLGIAQLGPYNRTDESFGGLAQVGAFNHSRRNFSGIVQLGAVSATGDRLFPQVGSTHDNRFAGIAQVGVTSTIDGHFYGLTQVGVLSVTSGDFRGIAQLGAFGTVAGSFHGIVQASPIAMAKESIGLQLGAVAVSLEEHTGIQIGGVGTWAKSVDGAQIGLANVGDRVRGVQIGLFNHARSLRGVQIGLANHAGDGVLPWTALLNMGFGDDPNGGESDVRSAGTKHQRF